MPCWTASPRPAHLDRGAMTRTLVDHTRAEREAALVPATTGRWLAPVTGPDPRGARP